MGKDNLMYIHFIDIINNYDTTKSTLIKALKANKALLVVIDNVDPNVSLLSIKTGVEYNYTSEDLEKARQLNNELIEKYGMKQQIRFSEFYHRTESEHIIWSLGEVIKANNMVDDVVNTIKEYNFSPYETLLYIYKWISMNFLYSHNYEQKYGSHGDACGSIVAAYKFKKIVCLGFASLTKAIIDKLNNRNLSCERIDLQLQRDEKQSAHTLNFINVMDAKYNINGKYAWDVTQDCKREQAENINLTRGFWYCMFPIYDMINNEEFKYGVPKIKMPYHDSVFIHHVDPNLEKKKWKKQFGKIEPISFDKFKDALTVVYEQVAEFRNGLDAKTAVENEIEISLNRLQQGYNVIPIHLKNEGLTIN